MRIIHLLSRIIVGVVFMFSGFVKGIDPLGTAYRIEDYFLAWGTPWLYPYALLFSILLSTVEFVLGFIILLNLKAKISSALLLIIMGFFTLLTFYDALENPVPDCGCFGDAIKLTNWQTFYKNIILMVPTLVLFTYRKKTKDHFNNSISFGLGGIIAFLFVAFCIWNYRHLPVIDFMEWKVGNKMYAESTMPVKYYLTYKNKKTGEEKEYLSPNYPFNDSAWMNNWEFINQRIVDPNKHIGADLQIVDSLGTDVTDNIIKNHDYQFILVAWDLTKSNKKGLNKFRDFAQLSEKDGYYFNVLTSSLEKEIDSIRKQLNLDLTFYQADDVVLKMMVRANPGLILLKDGVIIDKRSHNDFIPYSKYKEEIMIK